MRLVPLWVKAAGGLALGVVLCAGFLASRSGRGKQSHANPAAAWAITDSGGDGTPDFLRLDSVADRQAFRQWFTFLAESLAFRDPANLPRDVGDCAGLARFAYREALRRHDGGWVAGLGLDHVPAYPSVTKYAYPFTPLRAGLFRVHPGRFQAADLSSGAFAEFADARTLMHFNARLVGRELDIAQPGDLLFYRQLDQNMPFHLMVFLGSSHFEQRPERFVVYHTGPIGADTGEVRRPSLDQLREHPIPQWRPLRGNHNFLGVFRWNILADPD